MRKYIGEVSVHLEREGFWIRYADELLRAWVRGERFVAQEPTIMDAIDARLSREHLLEGDRRPTVKMRPITMRTLVSLSRRQEGKMQTYSGGDVKFQAWLDRVDALCQKRWGVGLFDLPDMMTRDAFDAGTSPETFVKGTVAEQVRVEFGWGDPD